MAFTVRLILLLMLISIPLSPVKGVKYRSVKEAVQKITGEDKKIYQKVFELTPEMRSNLKAELNWNPNKDAFKFYYSKDSAGNPENYAILLDEAINTGACFHKFCIGISKSGEIISMDVVELNCQYAFPLNDQRFLRQFQGCNIQNYTSCGDKINAITGATQSSDLVKEFSKRALVLFQKFIKE